MELVETKQLSDMKSDFINNINHELKTPLSTISIANKSLQNEQVINNPEKSRKMIQVIDRQTKRLQRLINQVLDISKWEKEEMELKKESIHINHFLKTITDDFTLKLKDKPADIQTNFQAGKDLLQIDPFHFTTAIYNLLDNAVRYSKNTAHIHISTKNENERLLIEVRDQGIGMDSATQQQIFEKFYRGQKGNVYHSKGLGLGLYYVKKSVEAHNGNITLSSKKAKGSSFKIYLPLCENQNQIN